MTWKIPLFKKYWDEELKENGNVDYLLTVPSEDTPQIQESHIMIGQHFFFSQNTFFLRERTCAKKE